MSDMAYYEILELYSESMRKAVDRCKELAKLTGNPSWQQISNQLNALRVRGETMANARSLGKAEIETGLETHSKLWATDRGN